MSRRQLADEEGHRWDVEDEGALTDNGASDEHRLRFTRDDGTEHIRAAPHGVDRLSDAELRSLLRDESASTPGGGPDRDANRTDGYGDVR